MTKVGYDTHVFICTNSPDNPNKCGSKGSEGLRRELKEKCQGAFGKSVRINASGCLGYCEQGIAGVIYRNEKPAEWLLQLDAKQTDFIFSKIEDGSR